MRLLLPLFPPLQCNFFHINHLVLVPDSLWEVCAQQVAGLQPPARCRTQVLLCEAASEAPCRCSPHCSPGLCWALGGCEGSFSISIPRGPSRASPSWKPALTLRPAAESGQVCQWHSGEVSGRDLQPTCLVLLQALSHPAHPARTISPFPPAPRLLGMVEDLRSQVGRETAAPSPDAPLYFTPWSLSSRLWLVLRHPAGLGAEARTSRGAGTPGARSTAPSLRRRPSASFLPCPAQKAVKDSLALISDEAALAQLQQHGKSCHQLSCRTAPAQALLGCNISV